MINLRLPQGTVEKLRVLRENGYSPSQIMRMAVITAIDERLAVSKAFK